ncbi:hypothetical protein [Pseudooceanicola sp.]|uniref:hypothetical protein n=1 Tax=Pseudooceanicola sp. TaxID=1914328 RepID=UPI003513F5A7
MPDAIRYDFDMMPVVSREELDEFLSRGVFDPRLDEKVALFRDPRAAAALRAADPDLREVFQQAGFSLGVSRMDLPEGTFARDHAAARREVIRRLHDLIPTRRAEVRTAAGSAFSLADFLDQTEAARPFAARERCKILDWPAWAGSAQPKLASQG